MQKRLKYLLILTSILIHFVTACSEGEKVTRMTRTEFSDKMKGAWAGQAIGVTYGYPVEFRYNSRLVPDSIDLGWKPGVMKDLYRDSPGAFDDLYVELTFLDVYRSNKNASAVDYALAFGKTNYYLWFANQVARNNIRNGIMPPRSGHWQYNPECTSIDFQIEADFIGLLYPGMSLPALVLADSVGHIMAYGDGYYGGVFVAQMYSAAFVTDDIEEIISAGLAPIPEQTVFHKMISDVVNYYHKNPSDWQANWQFINDKYGNENGSPFGVFDPWNIEASMNAAHVVTGLLYGNGDFTQTIDISARCGNDADCNPATAAGILGTIYGFERIPEKYKTEIRDVVDLKFQGSDYGLGDAIQVTEQLALENISAYGGRVTDAEIDINPGSVAVVQLEVARPDHHPFEKKSLWHRTALTDVAGQLYLKTLPEPKRAALLTGTDSVNIPVDLFSGSHEFSFTGNGFCTFGKVVNEANGEWNFVDDSTSASVYIDGEFSQEVLFPIGFDNRRFLAFFDYTLDQGPHTVKFVAGTERVKNYRFELYHTIFYTSKNQN